MTNRGESRTEERRRESQQRRIPEDARTSRRAWGALDPSALSMPSRCVPASPSMDRAGKAIDSGGGSRVTKSRRIRASPARRPPASESPATPAEGPDVAPAAIHFRAVARQAPDHRPGASPLPTVSSGLSAASSDCVGYPFSPARRRRRVTMTRKLPNPRRASAAATIVAMSAPVNAMVAGADGRRRRRGGDRGGCGHDGRCGHDHRVGHGRRAARRRVARPRGDRRRVRHGPRGGRSQHGTEGHRGRVPGRQRDGKRPGAPGRVGHRAWSTARPYGTRGLARDRQGRRQRVGDRGRIHHRHRRS